MYPNLAFPFVRTFVRTLVRPFGRTFLRHSVRTFIRPFIRPLFQVAYLNSILFFTKRALILWLSQICLSICYKQLLKFHIKFQVFKSAKIIVNLCKMTIPLSQKK